MTLIYKTSREKLQGISLESSLVLGQSNNKKITTRDVFNINKKGFGKMKGKESYLKGISMLEMKFEFNSPVKIYQCLKNVKCFSILINLGSDLEASIDNKNIRINAGSHNVWSFANAGEGYICFEKDMQYHIFAILFADDYLLNFVNRYPDLLSETYRRHKTNKVMRWHHQDIPVNKELYQIIHQIKNADIMGNSAPMYIEGKILELLALQINSCPFKKCCEKCDKFCKNIRDIEKMHEAKEILLQDINTPPTTYELSRRVGVNEKKLKYGFKEVFDQTIYGCLLEYKMSKAQKLLLNTDKTIIDVAYECGYGYPSHFTTVFKRNFGVSPVEYRKKKIRG